jgi:parafibromin
LEITGTDDSDTIMREIMQRERTCRTRFTVLQSTGKQFDRDITAFLVAIKSKEEGSDMNNSTMNTSMNNSNLNTSQQAANKSRTLGYNRFDQERYQTKDDTGGFVIDTKLTYQPNGGNMSMTPNPKSPGPNNTASQLNKSSSYFQSSQLTAQKTMVALSTSATVNSAVAKTKETPEPQQLQKRSHQNPIIIIPAARTSLIQMVNALDVLQELKYFRIFLNFSKY